MAKSRKLTRMQEALLETTRDMAALGISSQEHLEKVTLRLLGRQSLPAPVTLSPAEVKAARAKANVSQAVLATFLGVTVGYLSRLERGEARPSTPVARLLDVIRRKGIEAVL